MRQLVFVGGGHSHVQVLKHLSMKPLPDTRVTVVVDRPVAVYSGMVPGFVAGRYRAAELEIDVVPLARRAGARLIVSPALRIDAANRRIEVADRPSVAYDVAAIDIGSTVAGLELPGVREHALPTRPIVGFVERIDEILQRARRAGGGPFRLVVVGGGAGGVEVAFTLWQRLKDEVGIALELDLVHGATRLLGGYPDSLRRVIGRQAESRGFRLRLGRKVVAAEPGAVLLDDGERLPVDALLWVTGAVSHPVFEPSGLPTDHRGFVMTRSTLQVEGHDELFAVGDCATMSDYPETPKAGVYAVRQGPYLIRNLTSYLAGEPLQSYKPQGDFLTLLNLGDGTAVGAKWGRVFEGEWVMRLKDRIDRRFMRLFQVLDPEGDLIGEFADQGDGGGMSEASSEMLCGGCAAKVGSSVLSRALARLDPPLRREGQVLGLDAADDAAAWRLPDGTLAVASVDYFRGFTDDPYLVGRVAAVNAVSDLEATGAETASALALVAVPQEMDPGEAEETLFQVLAGARAVFDPLGIALTGGHTIIAPHLHVGFAVEGVAPSEASLLTLTGLRVDQRLVLSKPLGTGVLLRADALGRLRGPWLAKLVENLLRSNRSAAEIARSCGATAATDVTGFGLVGHLGEMLRAADLAAVVDVAALPGLAGAEEMLAHGIRSTFHETNAEAKRGLVFDRAAREHRRLELLFDPQTSGGLLFGVDPAAASEAVRRLHEGGDAAAAVIGRVTAPRADGARVEIVAGDLGAGRDPEAPSE